MTEHMMHMPFIIAAYAAACIVVCALIAWVAIDFRVQRRALADLEARGVTRRSATSDPRRPIAEASENA